MPGNIAWQRVNNELVISSRMGSGYEYRIREIDDRSAILIAEGAITDHLPIRRQTCPNVASAYQLADQWEREA